MASPHAAGTPPWFETSYLSFSSLCGFSLLSSRNPQPPQADSTLLSRFRHWGTIHQPERQLTFTHRPLIYHSLPGNTGCIYWGFFWKWLFFYKFPKIRFLVTCWSSTKVDQQAQCQGRKILCTLSTFMLLREVERGLSWCVYLGRCYKCALLGIGESRYLFPLCQNY